jgi:hypothetical protein
LRQRGLQYRVVNAATPDEFEARIASCVPAICATAPGLARLTTTPTLVMPGTSWAKVPTSLAARSGATLLLPVTFPPGRARLATKPMPTGSDTATMMIGMVEVARRAAITGGVAQATMMSMLLRSSSVRIPGSRSKVSFGQRTSMRRFCPSM